MEMGHENTRKTLLVVQAGSYLMARTRRVRRLRFRLRVVVVSGAEVREPNYTGQGVHRIAKFVVESGRVV